MVALATCHTCVAYINCCKQWVGLIHSEWFRSGAVHVSLSPRVRLGIQSVLIWLDIQVGIADSMPKFKTIVATSGYHDYLMCGFDSILSSSFWVEPTYCTASSMPVIHSSIRFRRPIHSLSLMSWVPFSAAAIFMSQVSRPCIKWMACGATPK